MKDTCSYTKTIALLCTLSVAFLLGSVLINDILLPFAAAFLSALLIFDKTRFKMLSLALVAVGAVVFSFINVFYLVFVLSALLCSFVLWLGYAKGANKAELSVYLTILYALCTAAVLYLIGAKEIGSYAFSGLTFKTNALEIENLNINLNENAFSGAYIRKIQIPEGADLSSAVWAQGLINSWGAITYLTGPKTPLIWPDESEVS